MKKEIQEYKGRLSVTPDHDQDGVIIHPVHYKGPQQPGPSELWEGYFLPKNKLGKKDKKGDEMYIAPFIPETRVEETTLLYMEQNIVAVTSGRKLLKEGQILHATVLEYEEWAGNYKITATVATEKFTATITEQRVPFQWLQKYDPQTAEQITRQIAENMERARQEFIDFWQNAPSSLKQMDRDVVHRRRFIQRLTLSAIQKDGKWYRIEYAKTGTVQMLEYSSKDYSAWLRTESKGHYEFVADENPSGIKNPCFPDWILFEAKS